MTRAVVFDFFGVVCPDLAALTGAEFARRHGLDPVDFTRFTHQFRGRLDHGEMSALELAEAIIRHYKLSLPPHDLCRELEQLDGKYYAFEHIIYSIITQLKPQATVALMSNSSTDEGAYLRSLGAYEPFDHVFLSGDYGLTKSDPIWFDHLTAKLGGDPSQIMLIDDRPANVATAKSAGWVNSLVYEGSASLIVSLRELGFKLESD